MSNLDVSGVIAHYDALFLDNDGTCARTEELHARIGAKILSEAGVPITYEERFALMGYGEHGIWNHLHAQGRTPSISRDEFKDRQSARFLEALRNGTCLSSLRRPGIAELAAGFKQAGKPVIVVSNTPRDVVHAVQRAVGLDRIVDEVISLDDMLAQGLKPKPAPDGYNLAKILAKTQRGRNLAVEDAHKGWMGADLAGCDTLHIYYNSIGQTPNPDATYTVAEDLDIRHAFQNAAFPAATPSGPKTGPAPQP